MTTITWTEVREALAAAGTAEAARGGEVAGCDCCDTVAPVDFIADMGGDRDYHGTLTAFPTVCEVCEVERYRNARPESIMDSLKEWAEA